jgi:uncharacterized membrane protein YfcA
MFNSIIIGTLSTLLGLGGGIIFSVILLSMNIPPEVIMSTNSLLTCFNSMSSILQYILINKLLVDIGIFCFFCNSISAYIGLKTYTIFKKKYNRQSVIIGVLSLLMILSIILIVIKSN